MYLFQDFKGISFSRILWGLIVGNTHRAIFLYRLSSWCQNHKLRPLATFLYCLNVSLHGCDISPKAKIGSGITIYHSVGIVIGEVEIGKNFSIFQNVSVGSKAGLVIGDNVSLNSGCCVLAKIGSHVSVGANAVVLQDVPPYSTAVGIPARIIEKNKQQKVSVG